MVLTHLILNDQIKARTQISKIAFLLVDSDEEVQQMAKLFFVSLSGRNQNDIYNVVPDAISRLSSDTKKRLPKNGFQTIMRFLLSFVQKERNSETLMQKLAMRFGRTAVEKTWVDLAYCCAQLPVNDRALKKLLETNTWRALQPSLGNEQVSFCIFALLFFDYC